MEQRVERDFVEELPEGLKNCCFATLLGAAIALEAIEVTGMVCKFYKYYKKMHSSLYLNKVRLS